MRKDLVIFCLLIGYGSAAQRTADVYTRTGIKLKNVEIVQQSQDSLMLKFDNEYFEMAAHEIVKIQYKSGDKMIGIHEKSIQKRIETELAIQLNSSKPGEDRPNKSDPALMLSLTYFVKPFLSAGIGTGLQSPHFNTALVPVFTQLKYRPFQEFIFVRGRVGTFIPLSPEMYDGGLFTEWTLGRDFNLQSKSKIQLAAGYTHQRMTRTNEDWWWQGRETEFRFNRATFSIGFVF